jgi:hypothetical protein
MLFIAAQKLISIYDLKLYKTFKNECLSSHPVSEGQKFRTILAEWFWFRVSEEVAVQLSACAAVIRRLNWGWRIHFQDITLL